MTIFFKRVFTVLFTLGLLALPYMANAAQSAQFQINAPDGTPLRNMPIYFYNGDIYSRGSSSSLYPYNAVIAKTKPTYLGVAMTDEKGVFSLDLQNYTQHNLVLTAGSFYYPLQIEKTGDLNHTPSADHVRINEWENENGKIKFALIYNWRQQSVRTIPLDASPLPEKPAKQILLKTFYVKRFAPPPIALEQSDIDYLLLQLKDTVYHPDLLDKAHRAITAPDRVLQNYAAAYLGKFGTYESAVYLIDALGEADVQKTAATALTGLTGEDFGLDVTAWVTWLIERNLMIEKVEKYLTDTNRADLKVYRIHLNPEKTRWGASLQSKKNPAQIGAPALSIDRETGTIDFIQGR